MTGRAPSATTRKAAEKAALPSDIDCRPRMWIVGGAILGGLLFWPAVIIWLVFA